MTTCLVYLVCWVRWQQALVCTGITLLLAQSMEPSSESEGWRLQDRERLLLMLPTSCFPSQEGQASFHPLLLELSPLKYGSARTRRSRTSNLANLDNLDNRPFQTALWKYLLQ